MITGTATVPLDELIELMAKADAINTPLSDKLQVSALHAKWRKIFEQKGLQKRDYIKLETEEAVEMLNDISTLIQ